MEHNDKVVNPEVEECKHFRIAFIYPLISTKISGGWSSDKEQTELRELAS